MEDHPSKTREKTLAIIPSQKFLMGVCSAFGNFIGVNTILMRLIFLLAFLLIGQPIVLIYSAFGILLPFNENENSSSDKSLNIITVNLILLTILVLLTLINFDQIKIKAVLRFIDDKIDSFSLLIFSIALIINNYYKEVTEKMEMNYKRLTLSNKKLIFGVCGGLAEYLNIPPNLMRILWIIFGIASFGTAVLVYLVLRFIIPSKNIDSQNDVI